MQNRVVFKQKKSKKKKKLYSIFSLGVNVLTITLALDIDFSKLATLQKNGVSVYFCDVSSKMKVPLKMKSKY